ncbi:MAG: hypothetical protein OJF55_000151 [Rhodanobacteraceae bacterium]|jgi:hypothetical protein|nr:MAG: hypothetical protein OJF55_000151 [Rhodanobacteraceae bacterium]
MDKRWIMVGWMSLATAAQAGTVVHMGQRAQPDGKVEPRSVIYAQGGQFRMDTLDAHGNVRDFVLVRDGQIWQVDVGQRTFYHFDKAALAGQQQAMQARMQAALQQLPAAQRAAMEAHMNTFLEHVQHANLSFTDTGRTDKAGSWACEVWQLKRNGKPESDACIAPTGALTGGAELVQATRKAAATAADVLSSVPAARAAAARFAMFDTADGFPVRTRYLRNGKPEDEEIVTSIATQSLPADKFAIPKGFTQTTMARAEAEHD